MAADEKLEDYQHARKLKERHHTLRWKPATSKNGQQLAELLLTTATTVHAGHFITYKKINRPLLTTR